MKKSILALYCALPLLVVGATNTPPEIASKAWVSNYLAAYFNAAITNRYIVTNADYSVVAGGIIDVATETWIVNKNLYEWTNLTNGVGEFTVSVSNSVGISYETNATANAMITATGWLTNSTLYVGVNIATAFSTATNKVHLYCTTNGVRVDPEVVNITVLKQR